MKEGTPTVTCPICGKIVSQVGLAAHTKDVHTKHDKKEPENTAADDYLDYLSDQW